MWLVIGGEVVGVVVVAVSVVAGFRAVGAVVLRIARFWFSVVMVLLW